MSTQTPTEKVVEFDYIVKTCTTILELVPDSHLPAVLAYINAVALLPYLEGDDPTAAVVRIGELTEVFYSDINSGGMIDL